jgi:hypothetical protein
MSGTSMAELKEIVAELSRSTVELRKSQELTDRQMKETDRQMKETDWRLKETDSHLKELKKEVQKFVGSLGREWGDLVESLTKPSCIGQLRAAGIDVTQMAGETLSTRPGFEQEWDVLLVNGKELVAVEVKSRFRKEDLERVEEKLKKFKGAFPQYRDYTVYGAVAAIRYNAGLERRASKRGLFVFMPSGEIMALANPKGFLPKGY